VRAEGNSHVEQILKSAEPPREAVQKLYRATLSREPLEAEVRIGVAEIEKDRKRGLENLQWALLNSPEFLFNY
jgi:hypothetical protein